MDYLITGLAIFLIAAVICAVCSMVYLIVLDQVQDKRYFDLSVTLILIAAIGGYVTYIVEIWA